MVVKRWTLDVAGRPMTFETGRLAQQANGAVLVTYGETVILVTATASEPRPGIDYFPLRVDFEERQYAQGRIPGSFFRREGKPTDKAILASRLTDRPIRPLFPKGFRGDIQIIATTLAYDPDHSMEIVGIMGASAALTISDIPWDGPIAAVKVGLIDDELMINPTEEQIEKGSLDLTVAGTDEAVLMVEAGADEVPEERILDAIYTGYDSIQQQVEFLKEIEREVNPDEMEYSVFQPSPEIEEVVRATMQTAVEDAALQADKQQREKAMGRVREEAEERFASQFPDQEKEVKAVLDSLEKEVVRQGIIERRERPDGRKPDEIRPVSVEAGLLPRVHGSGLFTRGETQALTVAALGPVGDRQMLDSLGHDEDLKRYLHHYNFAPFSVGETRPLRGPSRRETGHGSLGERALKPMIPSEDDFPYTIRLVSEVLSSNGSTSQASICGSTLALMDAGVPIKRPVAGIAMGLVKEGDSVVTLTDIQGLEDHLGDMDFKVAGSAEGVTALQMDIKIAGVERDVLEQALKQAREARLYILDKMTSVIPEPRPELSPNAPRITTVQIDPEKIRHVIGPGGKTINKIIDETGADIDIEDDGRIFISADDKQSGDGAVDMIRQLTRDVEVGEVYLGKVVKITNYGAFVEVLPGKDGLVHISNLEDHHVPSVEDVVSVGDEILVKVTEIDDLGRINLSREQALKEANDGAARETRQGH